MDIPIFFIFVCVWMGGGGGEGRGVGAVCVPEWPLLYFPVSRVFVLRGIIRIFHIFRAFILFYENGYCFPEKK